jgi:hypothetical protein
LVAMFALAASPLAYANMQLSQVVGAPCFSSASVQTLRTVAADSRFEAVGSAGDWTDHYESLQRSPLGGFAGIYSNCLDKTTAANPSEAVPAAEVVELPPGPSSSTLALSGLLTLGAWGAARSARNVQLASMLHAVCVPDWYYADATQVRHSVPFEFRLTLQPILSICGLPAQDPGRVRTLALRSDGDADRLGTPQYILSTTAPRGPPVVS